MKSQLKRPFQTSWKVLARKQRFSLKYLFPLKFLFLINRVPQVLCRVYHTVTELAFCETPTSFCGYEKKSVVYSMSKKVTSIDSIAWREPPQKESRSPHAQCSALSHLDEKPSTTIPAVYRWWRFTGRLEISWNTSNPKQTMDVTAVN